MRTGLRIHFSDQTLPTRAATRPHRPRKSSVRPSAPSLGSLTSLLTLSALLLATAGCAVSAARPAAQSTDASASMTSHSPARADGARKNRPCPRCGAPKPCEAPSVCTAPSRDDPPVRLLRESLYDRRANPGAAYLSSSAQCRRGDPCLRRPVCKPRPASRSGDRDRDAFRDWYDGERAKAFGPRAGQNNPGCRGYTEGGCVQLRDTSKATGKSSKNKKACASARPAGHPGQDAATPSGPASFVDGEELREGDIVLARSYGMLGAAFATGGAVRGAYSHAAMFFRDAEGRGRFFNYRPTGMESADPEDFYSRYNRLALIRPRFAVDGQRLSAEARAWLAKDACRKIMPDYRLDMEDDSEFFCLETVIVCYRGAGYANPFAQTVDMGADSMGRRVRSVFKLAINGIPSPNAILENPDFETRSQWFRPDYDFRMEALNEALIGRLGEFLAEGDWPRRPSWGGRMHLRFLFGAFHTVNAFRPGRKHLEIPDFADREVRYNAYTLFQLGNHAKKAAKDGLAAMPPWSGDARPGLHSPEVRRMTREMADCLRDRFLVRNGAPAGGCVDAPPACVTGACPPPRAATATPAPASAPTSTTTTTSTTVTPMISASSASAVSVEPVARVEAAPVSVNGFPVLSSSTSLPEGLGINMNVADGVHDNAPPLSSMSSLSPSASSASPSSAAPAAGVDDPLVGLLGKASDRRVNATPLPVAPAATRSADANDAGRSWLDNGDIPGVTSPESLREARQQAETAKAAAESLPPPSVLVPEAPARRLPPLPEPPSEPLEVEKDPSAPAAPAPWPGEPSAPADATEARESAPVQRWPLESKASATDGSPFPMPPLPPLPTLADMDAEASGSASTPTPTPTPRSRAASGEWWIVPVAAEAETRKDEFDAIGPFTEAASGEWWIVPVAAEAQARKDEFDAIGPFGDAADAVHAPVEINVPINAPAIPIPAPPAMPDTPAPAELSASPALHDLPALPALHDAPASPATGRAWARGLSGRAERFVDPYAANARLRRRVREEAAPERVLLVMRQTGSVAGLIPFAAAARGGARVEVPSPERLVAPKAAPAPRTERIPWLDRPLRPSPASPRVSQGPDGYGSVQNRQQPRHPQNAGEIAARPSLPRVGWLDGGGLPTSTRASMPTPPVPVMEAAINVSDSVVVFPARTPTFPHPAAVTIAAPLAAPIEAIAPPPVFVPRWSTAPARRASSWLDGGDIPARSAASTEAFAELAAELSGGD